VNPPQEQRLDIKINGVFVAALKLSHGMHTYKVEIPRERLQSGENFIELCYAYSENDWTEEKKRETENRAVAWEWIRFGDPSQDPSRPAGVIDDGQGLFLPFGSRIDYYLKPINDGVFQFESLAIKGQGRLKLEVSTVSAEDKVVAEYTRPQQRDSVPLKDLGSLPARLSLYSFVDGSAEPGEVGGIVLSGPVVGSRNPSAPVEVVEPERGSPLRRARANVVIYLIDTLRADHLGCYGYDRPVSPNIDSFAEHAVLFENAQAQAPWTRASVASILTGLLPQVHGANDDPEALSDQLDTLAEILGRAGYQTAAFTTNGNAGAGVGFSQGFEVFNHLPRERSEVLNRAIISWLGNDYDPNRPLFLFVHTVDPHAPYSPPSPFREQFAGEVADPNLGSVDSIFQINKRPDRVTDQIVSDMIDLYDAEIAANDHSFGVLMSELRSMELYEDSLVVVVSDHGEEFFEHQGWSHGKTLYAEQLDVPLIMMLPGSFGGLRVPEVVQHVDILPTVLDLCNLLIPSQIQGRSVSVLIDPTVPSQWDSRSLSYLKLRGREGTALWEGRWKLIQMRTQDSDHFPELYDRQLDRGDFSDLAGVESETRQYLVAHRERVENGLPKAVEPLIVDITKKKEAVEELRALGYIR
jgi:arylsulfatase A-like enzyme